MLSNPLFCDGPVTEFLYEKSVDDWYTVEESASAAEELSSQSVQLTEMVGELVALVGSATRANVQNSAPIRTKARHAAPKSNHIVPRDKTNPARMIPLDDAEKAAKTDTFAELGAD